MLRLRPHHLLCALGYEGKGYSSQFTDNMDEIVLGKLRGSDPQNCLIEVVDISDDICTPCPHRRGDTCNKQDQITALDQRHAKHLGLHSGQIMNWQEACENIKSRVEPEDLDVLCKGCSWLEAGMCKNALTALKQDSLSSPVCLDEAPSTSKGRSKIMPLRMDGS